MGEAQAQKVVAGSILLVGALVTWQSIKQTGKLPSLKEVTTLVVLAAVLGIAAGIAPGVAGPLAVLIAISVTISHLPSTSSK